MPDPYLAMAPKRANSKKDVSGRSGDAEKKKASLAAKDATASKSAASKASAAQKASLDHTPDATDADRAVAANLDQRSCKQRRLARRDTEEQVDRVKKKHLDQYDPFILSSIRGNTGRQTIDEYIADAIRDKKEFKGYLGSKFWLDFFKEFDVGRDMFNGMILPTVDEECDPDLYEAVYMVQHPDPTKRSVPHFVNWLDFKDASNLNELCGMCIETCASPIIANKKTLGSCR